MPFIDVRDIRMYYEIHGTGPRLLFFNGTGGDLRCKPTIFESPLAADFEILAHDQRGLGQTDRPDISYTMADYAMDAKALLEAVGWNKCNVLGISFGGMVAQEFALRYPHSIKRLVLACTSSGGAGGNSYPLQEFGSLSPRERAVCILPLRDKRRDAVWQALNPQQYQEMLDQMVTNLLVGANEHNRKVGARRQLEARLEHNTFDRLPNLQMPVFICGGRYDGITRTTNLEAIHKQIPHSHLELFNGGHHFYSQDPRAFERIDSFLHGAPVINVKDV
ncbi:3-oxoadipate enol-lactonase [Desulfuromusa kysingii]|uniref:3-oxoadipate enol-lactonase n=1 Tax=Desulfuromusa kysingii TaxID=37625 RepID=A0A1H4A4T9_9BACT|nr:alpha/beta hydrolase [Desulfuromusa kysingii]SEA30572.1 3-oxoadipate enol-lactonase [Desulfuromusa kysingii]